MKGNDSGRKTTSKPILVWFPGAIIEAMKQVAARQEPNRSKFIREAVREKLNSTPASR
ncbi:MAG: ribbon-helix-helix protein, CopG family [Verrucomicrobiota bacterium]